MSREDLFKNKTWTIKVCPVCATQSPRHSGKCLDDPPGLRPTHVRYLVVSASWKRA